MNINKNIKNDVNHQKEENLNVNKTNSKNKKENINHKNIIKKNKKNNSYDNEKQLKKNNLKKNNEIKSGTNLKDIDINNIIELNKKINNSSSSSFNKDKHQVSFKLLSDKQKTISNELKRLKENKNYINNISLKNLGTPKSVIDNNINNDVLKNIKNKEKELTDKLYSIKSQINNLLLNKNDNTNNIILKNELKNYLSFYHEENALKNKKFISKLRKLNIEFKNKKIKKEDDLKKVEANKQIINDLKEKEKENFLNQQRQKEKSIILKRKEEREKKIKNIMSHKDKRINLKKNYLYIKMENDYLENENNYIKDANEQRKLEVQKEKEKVNITKNEIVERARKQTNELHKLWHSRSLILQKLKPPIFKEVSEIEEKKIEKEKKDNEIKELTNNKKDYIKKHIKLPPISEILKKEMRNRIKKTIANINIKSRNKKIIINRNKFISSMSNNSLSNKEKLSQDSNLSRNKLNSLSIQTSVGSKIKNLKFFKSNNISNNFIKNANEINYLEELKQKRFLKSIEKTNNVSKDVFNLDNNDYNLKNKIEVIESKYKRNKELLKIKGGYLKNRQLGDNVDELLIDSIKGKLSIIENN